VNNYSCIKEIKTYLKFMHKRNQDLLKIVFKYIGGNPERFPHTERTLWVSHRILVGFKIRNDRMRQIRLDYLTFKLLLICI